MALIESVNPKWVDLAEDWIDGLEHEVPKNAAAAIEKAVGDRDAKVETLSKRADEAEGKLDGLTKERDELKTKLDEATSLGHLIGLVRQCRLPVSYLTDGQNVPDDIQTAERRQLAYLMLGIEK